MIMKQKGIKLMEQDEAENQSERDGIEMVDANSIIHVSRTEKQQKEGRKWHCSTRQWIVVIVVVVAVWIAGSFAFQPNNSSQEKIVAQEPSQEKIEPQKIAQPKKEQQQRVELFPPQKLEPAQQKPNEQVSAGSFQVQKVFWLYSASQHKDLLSKLYYENNQYFARKSGFKVQIVTEDNYQQFISNPQAKRLDELRKHLSSRIQAQECKSIVYYVSFLMILAENGGIIATEQFSLTETFDWLKDIKNDLHAKRGLQAVDAQMFAFFDPEKSSPSVKENINVKHQTQKYMRIFPGLDPYFIAAKKNCRFLKDMIDEILLLLTDQAKDKNKYAIYGTNFNRVYDHYFYIAAHRVLQQKQRELDVQFKDHKYRVLAVDHYSLYYTNHLGSLRKLFAMTGDSKSHVTFQVMSKQIAEEWAELFGPLRHLARLTPHHQMNNQLEEVIKGRKDPIVRGSFLQKTLYPQGSHSFIIDNPQKPFINQTSEPWDALPRKIWVFWDTGIQNAPLIDQLCVELMRIRGKESGFELHILSNSNAHEYISAENLTRIQTSLRNAQVQTFVQSKGDLVRLALLVEHGGVYFDVSYAPLTNLDWLVNIGKYPSHHIYNRYGHLPKVVMHYHPQWGGVFQWKVDPKNNTKAQWNLPYENNFIAAQKGAPLIVDWFNRLLELYRLPYHETNSWLKDQGLVDNWKSAYLMPMDTLMATIGKKQKEIKADPSSPFADATDYYKLWSINGYMGIQKFRDRTGFQSFLSADNTFIYRYSEQYVKAYLGLNFHLIKFYGQQNNHMSNFLNTHKPNNFSTEAHPESIFMRYYTHKDVPYEPGSGVKIRH